MTSGLNKSLALQIRKQLPAALPDFLTRQRWFGGKARAILAAGVLDVIPIDAGRREGFIVLAHLKYGEGRDETYAVPLLRAPDESPSSPREALALSRLHLHGEGGREAVVLEDALADVEFPSALLEAISSRRTFSGERGAITAWPTRAFQSWQLPLLDLPPSLMRAEQSNTSVRFGERLILKFFRKLEEGLNPDLEMGTFLTDKAAFPYTPPLGGALEYRSVGRPAMTMGILQAFVPNQGDAWRYTLSALNSFFEKIAHSPSGFRPKLPPETFAEVRELEAPPGLASALGEYWDSAGLLGRRTAQLHAALVSDPEDPNFRPEPISVAFLQSLRKSVSDLALQVLRTLEGKLESLPGPARGKAEEILRRKKELVARFDTLGEENLSGKLIRIHGDYHLGQVLYTGSDFVIIDFEGEPARTLVERRAKRCPLQDVGGMLRSFHYAAYTALARHASEESGPAEADAELASAARCWQAWVSARFLSEYLSLASQAGFLPDTERESKILLDAYLLDKACYELGYELNNRPDWVKLPLEGILQILGARSA